jgi:hypothetical protein
MTRKNPVCHYILRSYSVSARQPVYSVKIGYIRLISLKHIELQRVARTTESRGKFAREKPGIMPLAGDASHERFSYDNRVGDLHWDRAQCHATPRSLPFFIDLSEVGSSSRRLANDDRPATQFVTA